MIYTVTFNPSLDYLVSVGDFVPGRTNRTRTEQMLPGGKGLNVSQVLKNLGEKSIALGFAAGFVGEEIIRRMEELGVDTRLILLENGVSRINVKLLDVEGTEINGMGPDIPEEALKKLEDRLESLTQGDFLVLAGSIPKSVPKTIYRDICRRLSGSGVNIVVDAEGQLLLEVLPFHPFLIKPNKHELGGLFGVTLKKRAEAVPYARKLQEIGARNVLVSLAGEGAVLVSETGEVMESPAPEGRLVNGVGAGDSMVAGFLAGYLGFPGKPEGLAEYKAGMPDAGKQRLGAAESTLLRNAFLTGLCTGSASAFSEGLARKEDVCRLLKQMEQTCY